MKKDKIVNDFTRFPVTEKVEFGRNVELQMKDNPKFPTPDVTMDQLKQATDLLETRSVASLSGGKEETALLHQAETAWDDLMRLEARYVERIANKDGAVMLSAGFNLVKQPAPAQRPEFSVELGEKSGSVMLKRQAVEGAKSYIWQISTVPFPEKDSDYTVAGVTVKASLELENLIPLTKYWFRVAAVTREGTGPFTPPIMQVVI
jgi:hypothetical protein